MVFSNFKSSYNPPVKTKEYYRKNDETTVKLNVKLNVTSGENKFECSGFKLPKNQSDKEVKGSLDFKIDPENSKRLVIGTISTHPKRTGAGTLLVYEFAKYAKDNGYTTIGTDLSALEEGTPEFYKSLGFKPSDDTLTKVVELLQNQDPANPITNDDIDRMLYSGALNANPDDVLKKLKTKMESWTVP
jgi:hypothetical protein